MAVDLNLLTLRACEQALREKATAWGGRCFEIASRIVESGLVNGTAVYGHWLGSVHTKSQFTRTFGFVQHGWIVVANDARVVDPTRWAFEMVKPYLFIGLPEGLYDEGGNSYRGRMRGPRPEFDPFEQVYDCDKRVMDGPTWSWVERYLQIDYCCGDQQPGMLTQPQLAYLAHAPLSELGEHAAAVYAALDKLDLGALVPIDNRRRVEQGRWP